MDSFEDCQWGSWGLLRGREGSPFGSGLCLTVRKKIPPFLPSPCAPFYLPFSQWNKSFTATLMGLVVTLWPPSFLSSFLPESVLEFVSVGALWKNTSGSCQWTALKRENCELMRGKRRILEPRSACRACCCSEIVLNNPPLVTWMLNELQINSLLLQLGCSSQGVPPHTHTD